MKHFTAAALALLIAAPASADVLVDNVEGITPDGKGGIERFNGFLIGDDGRVTAVYKRGDKRPKKVDYQVDGKHRVVMPGMIDAHGHVMATGFAKMALDLSAARALDEAKASKPRPEDRDTALGEAQLALLAQGITAVADMGTTIEDWQAFRRAADLGRLRIRIVAYAAGIDNMSLIGGPGPTPWLYGDRLKMNGVKLVLDDALGSRAAWLKAPYADAPGTKGLPRMNQTQLGNLMSRAAIDNFQVAVDASGDAANAAVLDSIDELSDTYKGDRRWRIEHAQVVDPADVPRFGRHGVVASMQPQRQVSNRVMTEARLGPSRLSGAYAWKSIAATGAPLAFGSGTPAEPARPFEGMAVAITRQGADNLPPMGWQPQEVLTREAALTAYTTGAAYAMFAEDRLGRIAKGHDADFLFVDTDPMLASPDQLRAMKVLETWIGGKLAWSAAKDRVVPEKKPAEGR